jgi:signal transduction histidine kinase
MSDRRTWSLAGRLTRLFVVTTLVFVGTIAVTSAVFLNSSVQAEIDQMAGEELEEADASFRNSEFSLDRFEESIVQEEKERHRDTPMAWRLWVDSGGKREVYERGDTQLLSAAIPEYRVERTQPQRMDGNLRWGTVRINPNVTIGLVLDGSVRAERMRSYLWTAGILLFVSVLATLVAARIFFQRVTGILHTVAERTRAARPTETQAHFEIEGAPREIDEVVEALQDSLEKIRVESEQARVFTAGIAHELRSPVQNLIGETEVALIAHRDVETYRQVLRSHLEELRSLGDAVDNLVTICSQNETRRTSLRETFDLAHEAQLRLRREQALAERLGIDLDIALKGDAELHGDREAILRALRNLTQNAIQWSPPGGRVAVEIQGEKDNVRITVDDEGPGVPENLHGQIFEPFFRGPSAHGRRIGYGLGLALTRTAAEDQGGSIAVKTSPNGGARFELVLPRHKNHNGEAHGR